MAEVFLNAEANFSVLRIRKTTNWAGLNRDFDVRILLFQLLALCRAQRHPKIRGCFAFSDNTDMDSGHVVAVEVDGDKNI